MKKEVGCQAKKTMFCQEVDYRPLRRAEILELGSEV